MNIESSLKSIRKQIKLYEKKYNRPVHSVALLAVSKTRSVAEIEQAITHGQLLFGESYVQEAIPKIHAITHPVVEWHFIGPIQSNKCRPLAENFTWIHSVDRFKIAQRLNDLRPEQLPPLNICLQVNISRQETKSGTDITDLFNLASRIKQLPRLRLRGLMAIPAPAKTFLEQRQPFHQLHDLYDQLNQQGYQLDTLSMGMSDDYEAAIAEGATIIRVGSAIFGPRNS